MANLPFSQETITRIADEIITNLIEQDIEDVIAEFCGSLVEDFIPYTKGETPATDDLHCEVSGVIMVKIAEYIRIGRNYTIMNKNIGV